MEMLIYYLEHWFILEIFSAKVPPPTPRYSFFRNLTPLPKAEFNLTVLSWRHPIPTTSVAYFLHINKQAIHDSSNHSDEGLTIETLTLKLFTVVSLRYQLGL